MRDTLFRSSFGIKNRKKKNKPKHTIKKCQNVTFTIFRSSKQAPSAVPTTTTTTAATNSAITATSTQQSTREIQSFSVETELFIQNAQAAECSSRRLAEQTQQERVLSVYDCRSLHSSSVQEPASDLAVQCYGVEGASVEILR